MLGIHDPIIEREDMEAVAAAMSSGWLSGGGSSNEALEGILQDKLHLHTRPLSVVNGTGALQLAALLCGFERGDHALVSDNGFIGAANAVRLAGGEPILVGPSSHEDPSVSLEQITDLFSQHVKADGSFKSSGRKIRAFFHNAPYGMAGDMDRIAEFLRGRGVLLVEDAAQAFGVRQGGRYLGAFGDFGCWSFNGNKTLAAGAGGALFVADPAQRERALRLRHHGRCDDFEFLYEGLGGNYVMPNTLAALASSQFSRLDQILARKSQIRSFYEEAFSGDLPLLGNRTGRGGEPYWANVVLFPRPLDRDQFHRIVEALGQEGIQVRPCFPPLSRNAPFRSSPLLYPEHSLSLFNRGLMLPSGPGVTKEDVRRVKEALMRAWKKS